MTVALPSRAPDYEIDWPADGTYGLGDPLHFTGGLELHLAEWSLQDNNYVIGTDAQGKYLTSGNEGRRQEVVELWGDAPARDDLVDAVVVRMLSDGEAILPGRFLRVFAEVRSSDGAWADFTKDSLSALGHRSEVLDSATASSGASGRVELPDGSTHYREIRYRATRTRFDVSWLTPTLGPGAPIDLGVEKLSSVPMMLWHAPTMISVTPEYKVHAFDVWNDFESTGAGMWALRQRQALAGNAGGWPLRQRQNGNATGTWPLRQRQNGL